MCERDYKFFRVVTDPVYGESPTILALREELREAMKRAAARADAQAQWLATPDERPRP